MRYIPVFLSMFVAAVCCGPTNTTADDATPSTETAEDDPKKGDAERPKLIPLAEGGGAWLDMERKLVAVDGRVCLRRGVLELFACPKGGKEHESIVAIDVPAQFVHAGLLRVGGKSGTPVQWDPKYKAATGMKIDVWVLWKDKGGMHRKVRAQEWIRDFKTKKAMKHDWVFAGSGFQVDPETGAHSYLGDLTGDFICVSNFSTATLDLPIKSSADNVALGFEPFTERIPAIGTKVRLVLIPRPDMADEGGAEDKEEPGADDAEK